MRKKPIKIKVSGKEYTIKLKIKETGSNYNLFAHVFDSNGVLICGTSFKNFEKTENIQDWAINLITKNLISINNHEQISL